MRYSNKIIIIGPYPVDANHIQGGVEASVYGLAKELSERCPVIVLDMPRNAAKDTAMNDGSLKVYRFKKPFKWNICDVARINDYLKIIQLESPDVIHVHGTGIFNALIHKRLLDMGLRVAVTVHGILSVEQRNALGKKFSVKRLLQYKYQTHFERKMLNRCKCVIVDTGYVEKMLVEMNLKNCPKSYIIPQGINSAYFDIKRVSCDKPLILCVGGFSPRKGHLITMQAFDMVADAIPDVELVIAGCVTSSAYLEKMESLKASMRNGDRVSILPNIERSRLLELYSKASMFALHSEEESQGIVFAEAMASGLPIAATRVGGVPYVVKDLENGLLCDYGDVNGYAENMRRLLNDSALSRRFAANNLQEAKKYDWGNIADEVVNVYEGMGE